MTELALPSLHRQPRRFGGTLRTHDPPRTALCQGPQSCLCSAHQSRTALTQQMQTPKKRMPDARPSSG